MTAGDDDVELAVAALSGGLVAGARRGELAGEREAECGVVVGDGDLDDVGAHVAVGVEAADEPDAAVVYLDGLRAVEGGGEGAGVEPGGAVEDFDGVGGAGGGVAAEGDESAVTEVDEAEVGSWDIKGV